MVKLAVRMGDQVLNIDVEEMPVKVRGREFLLGDLHHVALAPTGWAYTVEGEVIRARSRVWARLTPMSMDRRQAGPSPERST